MYRVKIKYPRRDNATEVLRQKKDEEEGGREREREKEGKKETRRIGEGEKKSTRATRYVKAKCMTGDRYYLRKKRQTRIPLNKSKIYDVCRRVTSPVSLHNTTEARSRVHFIYRFLTRSTRFFDPVVLHASRERERASEHARARPRCRLFRLQIFVSRSPAGFVRPI